MSAYESFSCDGREYVSVEDVWDAGELETPTRAALIFDFVADDGDQPSANGCEPLPGIDISQGYFDIATRDLSWESTLELADCYDIKAVHTILAADKPLPEHFSGQKIISSRSSAWAG
jgi:hypothetical protein